MIGKKSASYFLILLCLLLVSSCSSYRKRSTENRTYRPQAYRVEKGDTLYSLSWRYDINLQKLAACNGISSPYTIYPRQLLYIRRCLKFNKNNNMRAKEKVKDKKNKINRKKNIEKSKNEDQVTVLSSWRWPTIGRVARLFNTGITGSKGIDITGKKGQSVYASRSGKVVYSGSGLIGYGKLLIVKHSEEFLTAYGYNSVLLVGEGDSVKAGQKIAKMGVDNEGNARLHFEIRRNGKPVDPIRYLPKKGFKQK